MTSYMLSESGAPGIGWTLVLPMFIPLFIIAILIILFYNNRKMFTLLSLICILFWFITSGIVYYYFIKYEDYDYDLKVFFNIFYIECILLLLAMINVYVMIEKPREKRFQLKMIALFFIALAFLILSNLFIVEVGPRN